MYHDSKLVSLETGGIRQEGTRECVCSGEARARVRTRARWRGVLALENLTPSRALRLTNLCRKTKTGGKTVLKTRKHTCGALKVSRIPDNTEELSLHS